MTHAIYCFLINDDEDDENLGGVQEYLENRTDENNWYQACIKVKQNGDIVQLAEEDDWRGRDGWYADYEKIPQEKRWAKVIDLADGCVRCEIESTLHCLTGDYKYELPQGILLSEIGTIANEFLHTVSLQPRSIHSLYWYSIERLGCMMGQLEEMTDEYPFTRDERSPYETIRAIDMRDADWDEKGNKIVPHLDNLAVVLVDIHT